MNTRLLAVVLLFLGSSSALSSEVKLWAVEDASIHGNNPTLNQGSTAILTVHSVGPKQALIKFSADSIGGETVQSATLNLLLNSIRNPGDISVHVVTSDWDEDTVTWAAQPTSDPVAVSTVALPTSDVGSTIAIDITETVQAWAAGSLTDFGLLVATSESIRAAFDSKEKSGGTAANIDVVIDDGPPPPTPGIGTPPIVLDLSDPPVVIDEPGHYVLDRNWKIHLGVSVGTHPIDIQANATLDLRGFEIVYSDIGGAVIKIGPAGATIVNGRISATNEGAGGIFSEGAATIRNLEVRCAYDCSVFGSSGRFSSISNSIFFGEAGVSLAGDDSHISNSTISCVDICLWLTGNRLQATGNVMASTQPFLSFGIEGDNNIFSQNHVHGFPMETALGLDVTGDGNLVFGNTFEYTTFGIEIDGTANVVKDNIVMPSDVGVGIRFLQDGNFYQNNQVSATVPFELNGTTQTDLGGNVSF